MANDLMKSSALNSLTDTKADELKVDWSELKDAIIDHMIGGLKFFSPTTPLTEEILRLNRAFGDSYFDEQYARLEEKEEADTDYREEVVEDPNWLTRVFSHVSNIIFHEQDGPRVSDQEAVAFFGKFISERVYNHLAMLSRSPHAKKGGAFSIREELTKEIAEKLGLGLYLDERTDLRLRGEAEHCLLRLAEEFQGWLTETTKGVYPTFWGGICLPERALELKARFPILLILTPDVRRDLKWTGAASLATA